MSGLDGLGWPTEPIEDEIMSEQSDTESSPSKPSSPLWWIMGTVIIEDDYVCLARKHRLFRYVQAWSWGRWNGIRDEYPQIPRSFMPN